MVATSEFQARTVYHVKGKAQVVRNWPNIKIARAYQQAMKRHGKAVKFIDLR